MNRCGSGSVVERSDKRSGVVVGDDDDHDDDLSWIRNDDYCHYYSSKTMNDCYACCPCCCCFQFQMRMPCLEKCVGGCLDLDDDRCCCCCCCCRDDRDDRGKNDDCDYCCCYGHVCLCHPLRGCCDDDDDDLFDLVDYDHVCCYYWKMMTFDDLCDGYCCCSYCRRKNHQHHDLHEDDVEHRDDGYCDYCHVFGDCDDLDQKKNTSYDLKSLVFLGT